MLQSVYILFMPMVFIFSFYYSFCYLSYGDVDVVPELVSFSPGQIVYRSPLARYLFAFADVRLFYCCTPSFILFLYALLFFQVFVVDLYLFLRCCVWLLRCR